MSSPHPVCRMPRLDAEDGGALVELAVVLGILGVPLLLATLYTSTLLFDEIEIANAAHAGALYGMQSMGYAADTAGITAAAQNEAADFGTSLTVTPTIYYACSSAEGGTQYSTQTDATTACTGGLNHPLEFLQVTASGSAKPIASVPGLPSTIALSSTSVMEVEE